MLIDGVSRELVEAAACGTYVEPENPELFATVISDYLYKREKYWATLGENGYQYAHNHFDREVLSKKYLEKIKDNL